MTLIPDVFKIEGIGLLVRPNQKSGWAADRHPTPTLSHMHPQKTAQNSDRRVCNQLSTEAGKDRPKARVTANTAA